MDSPRDFDEDKALLVEEPCCCSNNQASSNKKRSVYLYALFSLLNITIACITVYFNANAYSRQRQTPGWDTELHDARSAIVYEERTYTGALTYDYEKQQATKVNDSALQFFGPPSAQIDDAWQYLLHGEFPVMTEEEAAPFGSELQPMPEDHKYHLEPDMFHNLHCINAVRMKLNREMYGDNIGYTPKHHHKIPESIVGPGYENTHLEHCLDRLRQAVMCHGDLTPSPLYVFKGFPVAFGKSSKHTCRKFEPIREWMDRRAIEKGVIEGE